MHTQTLENQWFRAAPRSVTSSVLQSPLCDRHRDADTDIEAS